jgi:hypothetical protein
MDIDRDRVRHDAVDEILCRLRHDLAAWAAVTISQAGLALHVAGNVIGDDRIRGESPFGHGSDEAVGVALLLRIVGELSAASADLFAAGRHYAASALLRQVVEVEYLLWAIETRDQDAQRWLRSTREEREQFFSPAKLRSDLLGHVGRIWDHAVGWAARDVLGWPILDHRAEMSARFGEWKARDPLVGLPPPP